MRFSFRSISILSAVTSAIAQTTGNMTCGSSPSADAVLRMEGDLAAKRAMNRVAPGINARASNILTINVYFHVVGLDPRANGDEDGNDTQLVEQIQILNKHYYDASINFNHVGTTRTPNQRDWATIYNQSDYEMKRSLRNGTSASDLNIYIVREILSRPQMPDSETILGYASFPTEYDSKDPTEDGVVIRVSILPGGGNTEYGDGQFLSHEVGHWCGLYHTFQGGCDETDPYTGGDYVGDTPPQQSGAGGCPTERDSCQGGGFDAPYNIMDYVECMNQFTLEQIWRMRAQLGQYRGLS